MATIRMGALHNPFSSDRVRPGAVPYLLPDGVTYAGLLHRLDRLGGSVQVVGAHGSGKSTLLATLDAEWRRRGRSVFLWRAGSGAPTPAVSRGGVLLVDEYEALVWPRRIVLRAALRRGRASMVAAVHRSRGMPTLWHCEPDAGVLRTVVGRLMAPGADGAFPLDGGMDVPETNDIERLLSARRGSARMVLFDLYDRFEACAAPGPAGSDAE